MTILEQLSRTILQAPPDETAVLPGLLQPHLEGLFLRSLVHVWLFPNTVLYESVIPTPFPALDQAYSLVQDGREALYRLSGIRTEDETSGRITRKGLVVPIGDEAGVVRGGIFVLQREDFGDVEDFLPAMQTLAGQIGAALLRVKQFKQAVETEKMARELEIAGQIQATFLPDHSPVIPGWEISAILAPAQQTSGDFYDFVPLPNGHIGFIVADVADKGTGAALYMALSRTLLRTYAMQHPDSPATALEITNERIFQDTESDQFVTVFYAVLNPQNGRLRYANAGHNPAYLIGQETTSLGKTGIPLGMFTGMSWEEEEIQLAIGDMLVAYSDGIPEAQDENQTEYGDARFLALLESGQRETLEQLHERIKVDVQHFMHPAPQFDDITLLMVKRCLPDA